MWPIITENKAVKQSRVVIIVVFVVVVVVVIVVVTVG